MKRISTRTSPPKKGYIQKTLQKYMKKISKGTSKPSHKRGK